MREEIAWLLVIFLGIGLFVSLSQRSSELSELENSYNEIDKINSELNEVIKANYYKQGPLMPNGLDQHYERIRDGERYRFSSKGDSGFSVFHSALVLHDLGEYNFSGHNLEFINDTGISCNNLTREFAKEMISYIFEANSVLRPEEDVSEMQTIYEWVNCFVKYINETHGFERFPIETLTIRYGDCEDQAMAISFLLESRGYETAICTINDKNFTLSNSTELYHTFCVVLKNGFDYNGTLIELEEYPEFGKSWIILDSAYNHEFGEDPEWIRYYRNDNGEISIPSEVWNSLRIDYIETKKRANDIGIAFD